jgi:hypothetical protein
MSGFSADPFSKQMAQHWYAPQFTNPSVESFAYPIPFIEQVRGMENM